MSGRRADMLDMREILRRVRLGESDRAIAKALGVSRKTVGKYRRWAEQAGLPAGELPPVEQLRALLQTSLPETPPPPAPSSVEPYRELVVRWREQGLECQAIWQRLRRDHGFQSGYGAVWRFVSHLEGATPRLPCASKSSRARKPRWTSAMSGGCSTRPQDGCVRPGPL
jgi:hypothetical protein